MLLERLLGVVDHFGGHYVVPRHRHLLMALTSMLPDIRPFHPSTTIPLPVLSLTPNIEIVS